MGDGSELRADTEAIRRLGFDLVQGAGPRLDTAYGQLQDCRGILHSNYTTVTLGLAAAYTAVVEYLDPELRSKRTHLDDLKDRLETVAGNWDLTEQKSTVHVEPSDVGGPMTWR